MKTRPADIIFRELDQHWTGSEMLGRWEVVFANREGVQGGILGRASLPRRILTVREELSEYSDGPVYRWTTPGETTHNGNRHEVAHDWATVQATILKWASRRFRVAVES